jgi:1-acyl-sn-glycerol-3-phosphate acyltransferase
VMASAQAGAGGGRAGRPINLLYDAVGITMFLYCRVAFHVEVLGVRRVPWRAGPLVVCTHRSESDVPMVCGALWTTGGLWCSGAYRTHFAARDDMFEPGFFAAFPSRLPRAARRALYPLSIGPGLPLVRMHPMSRANGLRLEQALRRIPPDTSLDAVLPADALAALRARAATVGRAAPVLARDALSGDFAGVLWRAYGPRELSNPAFGAAWRTQVVRATGAVRELAAVLREGRPVLLFPEGRPSPDGGIGPLEAGLGALVRRGRPRLIIHLGLAYDHLTTGRTRALIALGSTISPPAQGVDETVLAGLRAATPLTCGQVLGERLIAAASAGARRLPAAELLEALASAVREARQVGRHVDSALEGGRAAARLADALRALSRAGLVRPAGADVALEPERILGDPGLTRLAREWESALEGGRPPQVAR